ncbi:MAG: hypothetical protein KQH57_12505 [Actinomycetales bacterium]|nr:hypothetical protein [Actinomycetales bacterium]
MAWQLTTLARGVQRLLGVHPLHGLRPSAGGADPAVERAARVREGLRADERAAYDTWVADRPEAALVLARTLAGAGRLAPVAEIAAAWDGWGGDLQAAVADPAHRLAADARQTDSTTCGSASLVLLAATGDPALAAWLASGWVPQSRPTELSGATDRAAALLADRPSHERFALLQQVVKRRTNARALGPVPWPGSLGTPPWGAARVARYPGVRWTHRMVDDTRPDEVAALWALVAGAVRSGVPVPLYAGGDSSGGWQTAVPRHVVLAVAVGAGGALEVFEPSSGRLLALDRQGAGPRPALGGWSHLTWVVLPG